MGFERFTLGGKTFKPKVSIRRNGQIGFNNGARKRFELDNYKYVILFYDKENEKIGIKLTNESNENGIMILQKRPLNVAVSAKSFLEFYELPYLKTSRYNPQWDENEKMLIIDLKEFEQTNLE